MPLLRIEVEGQTFLARLPDGPLRVGRDPSCEVCVASDDVSSVHATIEPVPTGGHKLVDANSGRPTRVNGLVAKRVLLKTGDVVEVGPARLVYDAPAEAPAPSRPSRARPPVPVPPAPAPAPVAVPRAVAVPPVPVAAVPAASAAPAPVPVPAPAPARAAEAGVAGSPVAVAEEPEPVPVSSRAAPRSSSSRLVWISLLVLVGVGGLGFGVAQVLSSQEDPTTTLRASMLEIERAQTTAASGDVDAALAVFDRLSRSPSTGVRNKASGEATYWRRRVADATKDADDLLSRAGSMDAIQSDASVRTITEKYGALLARLRPDFSARVAAARDQQTSAARTKAATEADALLAAGRFSEAAGVWEAFAERGGDAARAAAEEGRAAVDAKAAESYGELAGKATAIARDEGPGRAAAMLRSRLADFAGTPSAAALAERASAYDREAFVPNPSTPASTGTGPTASRPTTAPTPESGGVGTAEGPAPTGRGDPAAVNAFVTEGEAKAALKRYDEAAKAYEQAVAVAGAGVVRVRPRWLGLVQARDGLDLLVKTIHEHPDRFASVELNPGYVVTLADADRDAITIAVKGGRAKTKWTSIDARRMTSLVEAARVPGKEALPLAGILREVGAREAGERVLFSVVQDGGDKDAAFETLARWRGEAVPAGGYVAFEGRLVSTKEHDRLVLEARVAAACAKVASKDANQRKAAYAELLSLGAPAKEAFEKALRARRDAAAGEVATSKVFTAGRTRQRLQEELEKRRAAALALIEDPARYPYPSPTHQGQEEVDALVAAVRQVWEHPFELVSQWDKNVAAELALVTEVDDVLAKVVDGYVADLESVKATIDKAIDVPGIQVDDYSKKVLEWNLKVPTTCDAEERDDVLAVNEYRIMFGRQAVRINERLVRCARGHSIEMRVKDYFAHESPTPGLVSPQQRAALQGYGGGVSENIAMSSGSMSGRAAFDGWAHSSGHHRNMLGKGWTEMGVGRSLGGGKWTQNFGALGGKNLGPGETLPPPTKDVAPEVEAPEGGGETPPAMD
jgi:tetratricopeptide (TPR) repeat protein